MASNVTITPVQVDPGLNCSEMVLCSATTQRWIWVSWTSTSTMFLTQHPCTSIYVTSMQVSSKAYSVHLRTVSALLACARLAATYHACLWSIRACTMTSPDSSHIQATAARPHGCKNRAKYVSQRFPTLFSGTRVSQVEQ